MQALLRGLFHQNSEVAIVVSSLVIAALFQPLRGRIQVLIDRRFYRSKYDAARTLAAFTSTLRHEVDLSQLKGQLITIVQETMQPEAIMGGNRSTTLFCSGAFHLDREKDAPQRLRQHRQPRLRHTPLS